MLHFEERNLHIRVINSLSTCSVGGLFILSLLSSPVDVWRSVGLIPAHTNYTQHSGLRLSLDIQKMKEAHKGWQ